MKKPEPEPRLRRPGIVRRHVNLPFMVFTDADSHMSRCINAAHVETFVSNPFGNARGTLITFINGDRITVTESFDAVVWAFMGDQCDG